MADSNPLASLPDPRELSERDVRLISRAVLAVVMCAEKITTETAGQPPATSSAFLMFAGDERSWVMEGYLLMQTANLSAFDHARAFVALVRATTVRSTALATVARGEVESLARTFYLLSRTGKLDLVHRVISLLHSDLRFPALYGEQLLTRNGDPVDPHTRRTFYQAELRRLGLPVAAKIDLSTLVASMLNAEMKDGRGLEHYSDLSAVAHAHRLAVNTYLVTDENGDIAGLRANRSAVSNLTVYVISAISAVMAPFIELFGGDQRHRELFCAAELSAWQAIEEFENDEPPTVV